MPSLPLSSPRADAEVVIIGGSLTGLTLALACHAHGISYILVEKHDRASVYPRAKTYNSRAMEVFRALGMEEELRAAGARLESGDGRVWGATLREALAKPPPDNSGSRRGGGLNPGDALTPCPLARVTQDRVDPILKDAAVARGGDLRFSTEMTGLQQDAEGVQVALRHRGTGEELQLRARYAVAADGAQGKARDLLGIGREDFGIAGCYLNILFEADLRELLAGREFFSCVLESDRLAALLHPVDRAFRWALQLVVTAEEEAAPQSLDYYADVIREAIGVPGLPLEILKVQPWKAASRVAHRFRSGRVFLAGDAAHQMTPFMGNGASSGIQDAFNLAWKLALVLRGVAGEALPDSYEAERLPVTRDAVIASSQAADEKGLPTYYPSAPAMDPWVVAGLNFRYQSGAISGGSSSSGNDAEDEGRPGRRAPHAWLRLEDGSKLSTLDPASGGFRLLAGPGGAGWREAVAGLPVAVEVFPVGSPGCVDESGTWLRRAGIGETGALLVRPDDFVAWRALSLADAAGLDEALRKILAAG